MTPKDIRKFITDRPNFLLALSIAEAINQWLHDKGKSALHYRNYIDRAYEIKDIVEEVITDFQEPYLDVEGD